MKGADGTPVETHPEQTWQRVADAIGNTDEERAEFKRILSDFHFVPGGRILAGAGTGAQVTYYNCYVIPVRNESKPEGGNDSREAIFDTRARMVDIMSRGGGVGINWSTLRPKGAYLSRINGTTSGPLEWMHAASVDVGTVMQGGSRRGAAMFMLNDWHPDIMEFVNVKRDLQKVTNANISVGISDAFMQRVKENGDWPLIFPDTNHPAYNAEWDGDIVKWGKTLGYPVVEYATIKARDLWNALVEGAHDNGEPGVVFLDRYNELSTGKGIEQIICVNPCGEQGLGPYSVCNLGSMNLPMYIRHYSMSDGRTEFDWESFRKDVKVAIRFLDNVVDKNYYGDMRESEEVQMKLRRIGLSIQGLADVLIYLKMKYGDKDAIDFTESIYKELKLAAIEASADLAAEKSKAPAWAPNTPARPFFQGLPPPLFAKVQKNGLRNMFLLTQAPIGSTSILAGSNSGIEPFFAWKEKRRDRTNPDGWMVEKQIVADYLATHAVEQDEQGRLKLPDYFITANEVSVDGHVDMMAAAQKHIDSSISKTINAPNNHTVADVGRAYMRAYDKGLKAIAYFRDGSGRPQVLERLDDKPETPPTPPVIVTEAPKPYRRDTALFGVTRRYPTIMGTAFVTVNKDSAGTIREIFVNVGKTGSDVQQMSEAIARLVSTSLQHGITDHAIRAQLEGVGGYGKLRMSLPTAISHALDDARKDVVPLPEDDLEDDGYIPEEEEYTTAWDAAQLEKQIIGKLCPTCQEFSVVRMNGCEECANNCGYTAC
jgi:ribonucleoside-diphosphate reductase alpha chain